jgi:sulfhydrogenase subunit alpha
MTKTIKVEHLARVEGHGGIVVELGDGGIHAIRFDIFEGSRLIETLVQGRRYDDVAPIVSRICSICSVSHALTSLKAIENAFGVEVSSQTELLRGLMHRGERIASHALHLFLLAAPDYLKYPSATALAAVDPEFVKLGLRLKKLGNRIQETIGGRAIHPVNAVPGGFATAPDIDEMIALRQDLRDGVADCEAAISALALLPSAELCRSDVVSAALRDGKIAVTSHGADTTIAPEDYRDLTNERAMLFSNAKHSLYHGSPFMVGALARLTVNQDSISGRALWAMEKLGLHVPSGNPLDNNKAQAVELLFEVEQAHRTVQRILLEDGLRAEAPAPVTPREGIGTAVTEAPRGLLVHSYEFDSSGRIISADVITPTAMNAASIERHFRLAIEQNPNEEHELLQRRLEMLARAYDPCISCSVHLVQESNAR